MMKIGLTPKQIKVAKQLLLGKGNQEISDALGIAVVTVKLHISTMCKQTSSMNRTHLALTLERSGFKQRPFKTAGRPKAVA